MTSMNRRGFLRLGAAAAALGPASASLLRGEGPATAAAKSPEVKTGGIRMISVDGKYKVWTKKVGPGKPAILTLHGGPGVTHEYFECMEDFLPPAGRAYYYYDQLGSAYSDQPDDPKLWVVERFREEVEQVRSALGLTNFHLYGQSWGGMLGIEYALKYQQHLKSLVISNMTASIASYVKYINELRAKFPKEVIATLEKYEAKGEFEAPEYQETMFKTVYARHLCRLDPWPEPVERTFKHLNPKVYNTMQGPNEFVVNGTFKDWDRWNDLKQIRIPTLLIVGRYDTMSVADIQRMGKEIPNSRVAICENGSHLANYDDQEAYFRHLLGFWNDVDADRFPRKS
jgi:proline iminopeptidase